MNVEQLVEENNRKRKMLTPENEQYYSDMMIYIRVQLALSEQKTEEILLEMLDHVLDGQRDGKTAREIFGEDAKGYANEIIQQIPKEEKRSLAPLFARSAVHILSWFLMIRGIIFFITARFIEVDATVYVLRAVGIGIVLAGVILSGVWFIFRLIKNSLFSNKKRKDIVYVLKAGLFGAGSFIVILIVSKLIPDIGPSFNFPWWASLLTGAVLWLMYTLTKRRSK